MGRERPGTEILYCKQVRTVTVVQSAGSGRQSSNMIVCVLSQEADYRKTVAA